MYTCGLSPFLNAFIGLTRLGDRTIMCLVYVRVFERVVPARFRRVRMSVSVDSFGR